MHRVVRLPSIAFAMLLGAWLQAPTLADVQVFTDRNQWEQAAGAIDTENFNNVPAADLPKGTHRVGKITIDVGFDNLGVQMAIRDDNDALSVDGSRHFGGEVWSFEVIHRPTLIFDHPVTAFAADWADATNHKGIIILLGQDSIRLSDHLGDPGNGFVGVTRTEPFDRFTLNSLRESFGMDNLSFTAVPEPASILCIGVGMLAALRRSNSTRSRAN